MGFKGVKIIQACFRDASLVLQGNAQYTELFEHPQNANSFLLLSLSFNCLRRKCQAEFSVNKKNKRIINFHLHLKLIMSRLFESIHEFRHFEQLPTLHIKLYNIRLYLSKKKKKKMHHGISHKMNK